MSVYKRIATKWNDPLFNPFTSVSQCYEDFAEPIDIGWDAAISECGYAVPTEESVHHQLMDMRTKLLRIIKNWERTGQGEGSTCEELVTTPPCIQNRDPEQLPTSQLGHLENRSAYAMHSRKNFLDLPSQGKVGSWILYYWEQMDCFQLLDCTINILSNNVNAPDAQSAPDLDMETPNKKKRSRSSVSSIGTISDGDDESAIRRVGDGLIQYVEQSKHLSQHLTLLLEDVNWRLESMSF